MNRDFFLDLGSKTTGQLRVAAFRCEQMGRTTGDANYSNLAETLRELVRLRFAAGQVGAA